MKLRTLLFASLLLGLSAPADALAGYSVFGTPNVKFNATGSPGFLDIEGVGNTMTLADDGNTLLFTVPMTTVSTGIELRDDHMWNEFITVGAFPDATLSMVRSSVSLPTTGGSAKGTVNATFTVHGVAQPVTVTYNIKTSKVGYRVTASFAFDAEKSNIKIPSYMGITVDPKMTANVTVDLANAP